MEDIIVTVEEGKLRGKIENDIRGKEFYAFLGIPFAEPPIGHLRFKAPQPPKKWKGIKNATKEGNGCAQKRIPFGEGALIEGDVQGSEDCLFVNVFTHGFDDLRPVMVFVHGGGFTGGSGSRDWCGPDILMTEDIVFVTLNYRVGALGFLSIPDPSLGVPGNAALKDMVQALKWIKRNIKQFGGNPENVTIFGGSAGSASVHYLVLSPLTKGLFHKAIMMSGSALNAWTRGHNDGRKFAQRLGCTKTSDAEILKFLQEVPVEEIVKSQIGLGEELDVVDVRPFGPCVEPLFEGAFLTEEPVEVIRSGKYNQVPMIMGFTSMEGMMVEMAERMGTKINAKIFVPYMLNLEKNSPEFETVNKKITRFYFGSDTCDGPDRETLYLIHTDNYFEREIQKSAKIHACSSSQPVYLYRASVETGLNLTKKMFGITAPGVCHGDDVSHLLTLCISPKIEPGSPEDVASRRFVKMWTNFAKFNNPTPEDDDLIDVKWSPVSKDELHYLEIGDELVPGIGPDKERMSFWDGIFASSSFN